MKKRKWKMFYDRESVYAAFLKHLIDRRSPYVRPKWVVSQRRSAARAKRIFRAMGCVGAHRTKEEKRQDHLRRNGVRVVQSAWEKYMLSRFSRPRFVVAVDPEDKARALLTGSWFEPESPDGQRWNDRRGG